MSLFKPSHLLSVTDRSDASVIHQNFSKLHAELQALKQYVKESPTEPSSSVEKQLSHQDIIEYKEEFLRDAIKYTEEFTIEYAQKKIISSTTPPENPEDGDLWLNPSTEPPTFRRWNAETGEWEKLSVTTFEELEGMIDKSQLPDRVIDSMKLAIDAVRSENIATGAVSARTIQAEAVGAQAIAAKAILAKHVAAGEINANHLAASAVTADAIAAGAILAKHISARTINSQHIATEGLSANVIKSGVLTSVTINVDTDLRVGNNIYLGDQSSRGQKTIHFYGNQAFIKYPIQYSNRGDRPGLHLSVPEGLVYIGDYASIDTALNRTRWQHDRYNYILQESNGNVAFFFGGSTTFLFHRPDPPHLNIQFGHITLKALYDTTQALQVRSRFDTSYRDIHASNFVTSSSQKYKRGIRPFTKSALDIVSRNKVYEFDYLGMREAQYGLVYERATKEVKSGNEAISLNKQVGILWKAVQELNERFQQVLEGG